MLTRTLIVAGLVLGMNAEVHSERVTFAEDIAPIFNAHCVECHRPNQMAPMSLLSYKDARPWAKSIAKQVSQRTMPPWFASEESLHFSNKNVLTDEQIDLITRWADAGAPMGNRSDLPPVPTFNDEGWRMGTPDMIYTMDKPFTIEDDIDDIQPELTIDPQNTEDRWLQAIEVKPSNPGIVHHVLVYIQTPGAPRTEGFGDGELVGIYGPGTPPIEFKDGYGKLFPAGSKISLDMHYHKEVGPDTAESDQTSVAFKFAPGPVDDPVTTVWIAQRFLDIPPNTDNVQSLSEFTFKDDGHILSFTPHMHYRGKSMHYAAHYPDGTVETLIDVPKFDFNWQLVYKLPEPKAVPKGTTIRVTAHHDNTANNPYNPDPSQHIRWGSKTTDEMMIGFMDYSYETLKDQQSMMPDGFELFGDDDDEDDDGERRGQRGRRGGGPGNLIERLDENKDGKLSMEEVPATFSGLFTQLDTNKDSFVDPEEFKAFRGGRD